MKNRKTPSKASTKNEATSSPSSTMSTSSKLASLFFILVLTSIAVLIVFRTFRDAGLIMYSFHPALMAIGYLILMTHGTLAMADRNIFTQGNSYQKRVTTHWVLQATALLCITIGQTLIYVNKENNGYPHYQSTHSLFGLVTYLLTFGATLGGVLTKYSFKLGSVVKPAMLKAGHGFAGVAVYVLGLATIFLGLNQTWTDFNDIYLKFGILFAFVVSGLYVVNKSFKTALSRLGGLSKK